MLAGALLGKYRLRFFPRLLCRSQCSKAVDSARVITRLNYRHPGTSRIRAHSSESRHILSVEDFSGSNSRLTGSDYLLPKLRRNESFSKVFHRASSRFALCRRLQVRPELYSTCFPKLFRRASRRFFVLAEEPRIGTSFQAVPLGLNRFAATDTPRITRLPIHREFESCIHTPAADVRIAPPRLRWKNGWTQTPI
jgi:hypothetical protein